MVLESQLLSHPIHCNMRTHPDAIQQEINHHNESTVGHYQVRHQLTHTDNIMDNPCQQILVTSNQHNEVKTLKSTNSPPKPYHTDPSHKKYSKPRIPCHQAHTHVNHLIKNPIRKPIKTSKVQHLNEHHKSQHSSTTLTHEKLMNP